MILSPPLVSCLCITDNRVKHFARAYDCYRNQSYSNLELVVVCMDDDHETLNYINELQKNDKTINLAILSRSHKLTLGDLRNISIERSQGEYFCIWDDDDIYNISRVTLSMRCIQDSNLPAVALSNVIFHNLFTDDAYISVWRTWEQTLVCEKQFVNERGIRYASLNRGEDTPFLDALKGNIALLSDPALYIYGYHGKNVTNVDNFKEHFHRAEPVSPVQQEIISKISKQKLGIAKGSILLSDMQFENVHDAPYSQYKTRQLEANSICIE